MSSCEVGGSGENLDLANRAGGPRETVEIEVIKGQDVERIDYCLNNTNYKRLNQPAPIYNIYNNPGGSSNQPKTRNSNSNSNSTTRKINQSSFPFANT